MLWLDSVRHDIRHGCRLIRKSPMLSIATILTLPSAPDLGGGLNVFFARSIGVRGELRHRRTFKDFTLPGFQRRQARFLARQRRAHLQVVGASPSPVAS